MKPDGMGLQQFVRDALVEVISGVHEAAEQVREKHVGSPSLRGAINPEHGRGVSDVQFEVAVTVSSGKKGGMGLRVPYISASGELSATEQAVNRIRFSVPVAFASQPVDAEYIVTGAPGEPPES